MKSNSLALESLVVARDGAALTAPLSLTVAGGQMLAIHGSNGAGKSTLLKTIAGLIPIHSGAIRYTSHVRHPRAGGDPCSSTGEKSGEELAAETSITLSPKDMFPRPLYLGHKRGLTPTMNVYDNVSFWAKAARYPELAAVAMHYFDLTDIADAPVESLSAGWQQRVALTRLITMPSALWLLDEPTANLDAAGVALLQSLMQSRLEQGGIILVATHIAMHGDGIKSINISEINEKLKVNS